MVKKCIRCDKDFTPSRSDSVYCSRRCGRLHHASNNKEIYAKRSREWSKKSSYILLKRFGITYKDKDYLLNLQGGVCGNCGTTDPKTKQGWSIDHDHDNGGIRGILCNACNVYLGNQEKHRFTNKTLDFFYNYLNGDRQKDVLQKFKDYKNNEIWRSIGVDISV